MTLPTGSSTAGSTTGETDTGETTAGTDGSDTGTSSTDATTSTTDPTTVTTSSDPTVTTTAVTTGNTSDDPCAEMPMGCTGSTTDPLPEDPCDGFPDGIYCGTTLGGTADHGSLYQCMGGMTFSAQPCDNGCDNNLCNPAVSDPCESAPNGNGYYCGQTLSGGSQDVLYLCQDGNTADTQSCANGCLVKPPGFPDECAPEINEDLCQYANAGDGLYCGSNLKPGPADNVLFDCQGGMTISEENCANGCLQKPPGEPDACAPMQGNNDCCLEKPPGTLTQSYSACGNGGSHYGIDYGVSIGTPIYAGMAGTVVGHALGFPNCYNNGCSQSCWNAFNYVKVKSDCGDPNEGGKDFFIYYLHIDGLAPGVGNGTHVDQDQLVAYSGNSGCSSGPHIHIETASVPQGNNATLNTCSSQNPAAHYCP
ncbi:MAG: M23 family metallopeptidase [Planctomycetes bacterium]|nr:M23 family metallopeptidase [Planctomycetota bacterium]